MPALTRALLIAVELVCGIVIGSVLASTLITVFDPLIIFVIILATIVAVLDFADFMPAFSLGYFAGYIGEFLYPLVRVFGDFRIPALVVALIGIGVVVALKAMRRKESPSL
ncbi:MAG TPA: hypothetical protein VLU98_00850 [Methanomicrobiales archaeon]|nr:hypothetical protein [Methanomicrobiales archaeon]